MTPVNILEYQRRLTIVGAIRAGAEKPARGPGQRLEHWRLTSARRDLIEQASRLYGGPVTQWESPTGPEWQVYTEMAELPVYVMPRYSVEQHYELWEGPTKRLRVCDGDGSLELLSEQPCLCQAEGVDRCDIYTRVIVALPELDTVLGWKLTSTGASAAHELPTTMTLIRAAAQEAPFVPARLRLDQRRGSKDGQVTRFVVPVVDLSVGYLALGAGHAPGEERAPALEAAAEPRSLATGPAAAAPPAAEPEPERQTLRVTALQKKQLNVLVGELRDKANVISTEQLWRAVAPLRGEHNVELMIGVLDGRDQEGVLHWSPLRETLTRPDAAQLIDRLKALQAKLPAADSTPSAEADSTSPEALPFGESVPWNTFPAGY